MRMWSDIIKGITTDPKPSITRQYVPSHVHPSSLGPFTKYIPLSSSSFLVFTLQRVKRAKKIIHQKIITIIATKQARKLGRCDSNLQNLKTLLTHSLTHPMTGVGARRCYRI